MDIKGLSDFTLISDAAKLSNAAQFVDSAKFTDMDEFSNAENSDIGSLSGIAHPFASAHGRGEWASAHAF